MKQSFNIFLALIFVLGIASHSAAVPLSMNTGTEMIAIDGDGDSDTTVNVLNLGGTEDYTLGYFLNGSSTFTALSTVQLVTFEGGDFIDFALFDGTNYFTLSDDQANDSFSVEMVFGNEVTTGSPQKPADWSDPYYYNVNITWYIADGGIVNTNQTAINFHTNGNDGIAPTAVPEPSILLYLGSGLLGLSMMKRRNRQK